MSATGRPVCCITQGACAKPRPPLTDRAEEVYQFITEYCLDRRVVSAMGDVIGLDMTGIAQVAGWVGFEIGVREYELIRVIEREWIPIFQREAKKASERAAEAERRRAAGVSKE